MRRAQNEDWSYIEDGGGRKAKFKHGMIWNKGSHKSVAVDSRNRCFYTDDPFTMQKVEVLSERKGIVLFHDALSQEDIRKVKRAAIPYLSNPQTRYQLYSAWVFVNLESVH